MERAFEEFKEAILDHEMGTTAADVFTTGWCSNLAVALQREIPEGRTVAVVDFFHDERPEWLIHAGLRLGDFVVDVEGIHEVEKWFDRWSELSEGDDCDLISGIEAFEVDSSGNTPATEIAARIVDKIPGELIAAGRPIVAM